MDILCGKYLQQKCIHNLKMFKFIGSIFVFVLLSCVVMAQEPPQRAAKPQLFAIGLDFSPNYSYRRLSYPSSLESFVRDREKDERAAYGYNGGLKFIAQVKRRGRLEVGVQFARQTHRFVNIPINDTSEGEIVGYRDVVLQYDYLMVPLKYRHRVNDTRIQVDLILGGSLNFLLGVYDNSFVEENSGREYTVREEYDKGDFNQTGVSLITGLCLGYELPENWTVQMSPLYRRSLSPTSESSLQQFNYSLGCELALLRRF